MEAFGILVGILVLIILVIIGIGLGLSVLLSGFVGAIAQCAWASEKGFIGVVIFIAAWYLIITIMASGIATTILSLYIL